MSSRSVVQMKLVCGVLLALVCQVHCHVLMPYSLPDHPSLIEDHNTPTLSGDDDMSPEFGLSPDDTAAFQGRGKPLGRPYSNLVVVDDDSKDDSEDLPFSNFEVREKLLAFPAREEKYEYPPRALQTQSNGPKEKRQQGWHIEYGKRSNGRSLNNLLAASPDRTAADRKASKSTNENLLSSYMDSILNGIERENSLTGGELSGNSQATLPRTVQDFWRLGLESADGLGSPYVYDSPFHQQNQGRVQPSSTRLRKRQQGWHIPYGKRSGQLFNEDRP